MSNNYKSQIVYIENNMYKRYDNRTFNNTDSISKHINQHTTDIADNYKTNKASNLKNVLYVY